MHFLYYPLAFALPALAATSPDDSKSTHVPCTIRSPTSGAFFNLNPVHIEAPKPGSKASKDARIESWSARGYDYGANFTLNFCGPVVEEFKDVVGVDEKRWGNISAYYEMDGKVYSIGYVSMPPVARRRMADTTVFLQPVCNKFPPSASYTDQCAAQRNEYRACLPRSQTRPQLH